MIQAKTWYGLISPACFLSLLQYQYIELVVWAYYYLRIDCALIPYFLKTAFI